MNVEDNNTDQPEDVLDLTEELDTDAPEQVEGSEDTPADDDGDELIVTLEGEEPTDDQPADNSVIRQLRAQLREEQKRRKELEQQSQPQIELGDKPTLETCDYDEARFEEELTAWHERKREVEKQQEQSRAAEQEARAEFEDAGKRYQERKAAIGLSDFAEREAAVEEALGSLSAVIAVAAKDPALVVAALGKAPAKLAELQKIKNPFRLAGEIARIESGVKTMPRKAPPAPDRPLTGSASITTGAAQDQKLSGLRKRAEQTGDWSEYLAAKREARK